MDEYKRIAKEIAVPSFFALLSVCSVIFLAYSLLSGSKSNTVTGIIFFLASVIISLFYARRFNVSNSFIYTLISLLISLLILMRILISNHFLPVNDKSIEFTGIVNSVLSLRYSNEVSITFKDKADIVNGSNNSENTAISYVAKEIKLNPGDTLEISTKPKEIKTDYKNNSIHETGLLRKGYRYIFFLDQENLKVVKKAETGIKDKIRNAIEANFRMLFDERTIPILKGLYFANSSYIDKATAVDFKRAGLLHILAASGEHIGVIAAAILILFSPLLMNRKAIRIIVVPVLFFYIYITDMPVSLLRAFIMYLVFTVQHVFDLEKNIFNTLFLSAIVILAVNPFELYSLGFQLSFAATFGILAFYNLYANTFFFLNSKIANTIAVTLSAQVFILPVIFIQMKEINLSGLLSSLVVVFSMSLTLIVSLIANFVSLISIPPAKFFALATDALYSGSLFVIQKFSNIHGHFRIQEKSYFLLLPYLLFLLPLLPFPLNKKIKSLSVVVSVIFAWIILSGSYSIDGNRIAILNDNNNSVIILKEKRNAAVYGTIKSKDGVEIVTKYLNDNYIKSTDLFMPEPDYLNVKNYTNLIKRIIVSDCYISPRFMFTGYFKKFCSCIDADGIKLKITEFKNYKRNGSADYDYHMIKQMPAGPLDIHALYNLFISNSGMKDVFMEDIIDLNYKIEYLE